MTFVRVADDDESYGTAPGSGAWVDAIPDFAGEGPGVTFSGSSPGSPTERAGVQRGDILVRFGERTVRNLYGYTRALAERKPGDVVVLVVRRHGEEVSLELTLDTRPLRGGSYCAATQSSR